MGHLQKKGGAASPSPKHEVRAGVTVIGPGNWGTALVAGLLRARVPVGEVVVSSGRRRRVLQRHLPEVAASSIPMTTLAEAALDTRVLWLCVPDAAIAPVAEEIAARRGQLRGQIVVHSSGALSSAALAAVRSAGAEVASLHPVMSFPTRSAVPLKGVLFGVEGTPNVRRALAALVRSIGGRPFPISAKNKALYHAAGTLASPLLVSALSAALAAARLSGLSERQVRRMLEPMALATVRNLFERGAAHSFSGPFARGDVATIQLHLRALQAHPNLTALYRALALYAVETLPMRQTAKMRALLEATATSKPTGAKQHGK